MAFKFWSRSGSAPKPERRPRATRQMASTGLWWLTRVVQLLCAVPIAAAIYYMEIELPNEEHPLVFQVIHYPNRPNLWSPPWFYHVLHVTSHVAILEILIMPILRCVRFYRLGFEILVNLVILGGWAVGFAALAEYTARRKIFLLCGLQASSWTCDLYEAIFALSLVAFLATLTAVIIDVVAHRAHRQDGKYSNLERSKETRAAGAGAGARDDEGASMMSEGTTGMKPMALKTDPYEPRRGQREPEDYAYYGGGEG